MTRRARRRGLSLIEVAVALVLVGLVALLAGRMLQTLYERRERAVRDEAAAALVMAVSDTYARDAEFWDAPPGETRVYLAGGSIVDPWLRPVATAELSPAATPLVVAVTSAARDGLSAQLVRDLTITVARPRAAPATDAFAADRAAGFPTPTVTPVLDTSITVRRLPLSQEEAP